MNGFIVALSHSVAFVFGAVAARLTPFDQPIQKASRLPIEEHPIEPWSDRLDRDAQEAAYRFYLLGRQ